MTANYVSESAIPLMDENIALNNLNSQMNHISTDHENEQGEQSKGTLVDARVLDWDQPIPAWVNNDHPELVMYVHQINVKGTLWILY